MSAAVTPIVRANRGSPILFPCRCIRLELASEDWEARVR